MPSHFDPTELLDLEQLESLRASMPAEIFQALITAFAKSAPTHARFALAAAQDGERDRLRRAAHELRGSASNFGAVRLEALARQLEDRCETLTRDEAVDRARELALVTEQTWRAIEARLAPG